MARFALVIASNGLHLYRLGGTHPVALPMPPDEISAAALLANHTAKGDALFLYTDLSEETYARSELPRLWSTHMRRQLLGRRLVQQYPDYIYRAAMVVKGRLFDPPRLASLIGVAHHFAVDAVREAALARGVRLAGMWPISLLLARAAAASGPRNTFLLTVQLPGGLRHILVQRGAGVFSRISPAVPADDVGPLMADARRTTQYLAVQGWRAADAPVLKSRIWHAPGMREPPSVVAVPGLDLQEIRVEPDPYSAALAQRPSPTGQLLPAAATLAWRASELGRATLALGVAALVLSAGWAGWTELRTHAHEQQIEVLNQRANAARRQTADILATAKGNLGQADLAQAAVAAWTRLIKQQPDHVASLRALSGVLADFPDLRLDRLAWQVSPAAKANAETTDPASAPPAGQKNDIVGCVTAAESTSPEAGAATVPPAAATELSLRVNARLPSSVSLRQRAETQERFVTRLKQLGWKVRVIKGMVDQDEQAVLAGVVGEPAPAQMELCMGVPAK
ncbi:MAG: hypothetical protein KF740_16345 [Ramlibacter sp.]|nr:hypothetical protein [Ramlibacter sp.]